MNYGTIVVNRRQWLVSLLTLAAASIFAFFLAFLIWVLTPGIGGHKLWLIMAVFASLGVSALSAYVLICQWVGAVYRLTEGECTGFVGRMVLGLSKRPPLQPLLRVQEGHPAWEAPELFQKVGGPAYLSVGHDSVVITQQYGTLQRILGPGLHVLAPFEKVWEVIDLRPQRRTLTVGVMTRDGIPVSCKVGIRFHIDHGGAQPTDQVPYPYSEEAVFRAAMAIRHKGNGAVQRWPVRLVNGTLDGEVRNRLEKYHLDDFLAQSKGEHLIGALEGEILEAVRKAGRGIGVYVDEVQLGPVLPEDEAISRQWLETWQSEWQRFVATEIAKERAEQTHLLEKARQEAELELFNSILPTIEEMHRRSEGLDLRLLMLRFLDTIQAIAGRSGMTEELHRTLRTIVDQYLRSCSAT